MINGLGKHIPWTIENYRPYYFYLLAFTVKHKKENIRKILSYWFLLNWQSSEIENNMSVSKAELKIIHTYIVSTSQENKKPCSVHQREEDNLWEGSKNGNLEQKLEQRSYFVTTNQKAKQ